MQQVYIISFVHFACFLIDIGLITLLLYKNHRSALNYICSVLIFTFAIWSFGYSWIDVSQTAQTAFLWLKIGAIGWCLFPAAALYFYLSLVSKTRLLKNLILLGIMIALSSFFIYQVWAGHLVTGVLRNTYWWYAAWSKLWYSYLFYAYYFVISLVCIYLMYNYGHQAHNSREKIQARLQIVTATISLVLASTTNVILPVLQINVLPQAADIIIMIWEAGIILSIVKYGLMTVSPATASDQILDTMTDFLVLLDTEGTIKMANRAQKEMLGVQNNEIEGLNFRSLVLEKEHAESFLRDVSKIGKIINHEFTYVSKNGRKIQVQVSGSSVFDKLKTRIGYVVVAHDITERKCMEEQNREYYEKEKRQRQELEEEVKIRIRFVDVLAHELRNPLTPILVSADMLNDLSNSNQDPHQKKLVQNIHNGTLVLARRLEELLDLARFARGQITLNIKSVDINEFVEEVVARYRPIIDKRNQSLILKLEEGFPAIQLDSSRIEQVLVNLLSNASKYSPENSQIVLAINQENNNLLVRIKDNGMGISPEDQEKIFQPYQRLGTHNESVKGLGLGLTVVKQIVEAHSGKIWVSSQPGEGSTFSFTIPIKSS
jgi:PAS domain S-box-containing protein